jgi:hypothetical protein
MAAAYPTLHRRITHREIEMRMEDRNERKEGRKGGREEEDKGEGVDADPADTLYGTRPPRSPIGARTVTLRCTDSGYANGQHSGSTSTPTTPRGA